MTPDQDLIVTIRFASDPARGKSIAESVQARNCGVGATCYTSSPSGGRSPFKGLLA